MEKFKIPTIQEEKTMLKTIRIKVPTYNRIETLATKHNISMNKLINDCIEYALNNLEEDEEENTTQENNYKRK